MTPFAFFQSLKDGMNSGLNPALLPSSQCARMTNAQIEHQLPATRPGIRVLPMSGRELLNGLSIQGALIYNPAKGLSQQTFAADLTRVVLAAGGRKFEIRINGSSAGTASASLTEINGPASPADLHLCWMYQAETFAISQDGEVTWVWDTITAFKSTGYRTDEKERSSLSNNATAGVYSHGRILQVVDGRQVLIGDIIHKSNQTSPINILGFTEQTYWATGSFLTPPSNIGGIMAAAILPRKNTTHGHAETMLHSPDGVFSVDLNIFPRSEWANRQLTNHALMGTGACGPYCLTIDDGDQIFRSKHGIQSLRSAAAEAQDLGNPVRPISWQVNEWMKADHKPYLRFCSLEKWDGSARILCTTGMVVKQRQWHSRGIVSQNLNPVGAADSTKSWEGLWTLPPQFPKPVLILSGDISREDRCLVLCYDDENQIQLAEIHPSLDRDWDQCGYPIEISAQVITAELATGDVFAAKEHRMGSLIFRKLRRDVKFGVWLRAGHDDPWVLWKMATVHIKDAAEDGPLRRRRDKERRVSLGDIPTELAQARKLQALIRWKGYAQIEGIKLSSSKADAEEGVPDGADFIVIPSSIDYGEYDDYEYTTGSNWAINHEHSSK